MEMEWNLKGGCWDLSELEEARLSNIEENTVKKEKVVKNGEFCVDLKLGHHDDQYDKVMGNCGISRSGTEEEGGGGVVSAPKTASSKRARGGNNNSNNGSQTASCLVDGCESDLSNCRDYHRRHKVCELHSKTPVVTIGGHKQRFCQQCSRFHSLEEFDEGKRSCRKRLDGHNRRRRKPQPVPLTRSPSFFSNYQGTQLVPLCSSSHVYPSSGWDGRFHHHHQQHQQVPKQELFLGSMATPTHTYNINNNNHKQLLNNNTNNKQEMTTYHHLQPPPPTTTTNPLCALSLLSSSSSPMPLVHPLGLSLHDQTLDLHDHSSNALVNNNQSIHHPSMYSNMHMPSHASSHHHSNQSTHPSLPFHWE